MKSLNLVLLLMCLSFLLKAQDTLTLKNGTKIPAKVLEVNSTSVKYKHANNITGPDYVDDKANIFIIKYGNGSIDSFKVEPTTTIVSTGQPTITIGKIVETPKKANVSFNKIVQIDNKYYFASENNERLPRPIGVSRIGRTAQALYAQKQIPALEESLKKLRKAKVRQTVFGITGAPLVLLGFATTLVSGVIYSTSYSSTDQEAAAAGVSIGAVMLTAGVTFEIVSIINGGKKKQRLKETVDLYNQNL